MVEAPGLLAGTYVIAFQGLILRFLTRVQFESILSLGKGLTTSETSEKLIGNPGTFNVPGFPKLFFL